MNNLKIQHYLLANKHVGSLPDAANVITLQWQHPASLYRGCFYLALEQDRITVVKYKVYGCAVTIACMAWSAEFIEGKTLAEMTSLTPQKMIDELAIIPEKQYIAMNIYELLQKIGRVKR